jgi:hypothetical protein
MNEDLSENSCLNSEQIWNLFNEDDDLKKYNLNQGFNIYDSIYPIQFEFPRFDFEFEFEDFITEGRRITSEVTINTKNEHDIVDKKKNLKLLMV